MLDRLLKLVQVGQVVRIEFTGTEESDKGSDTKIYLVEKRRKVEGSKPSSPKLAGVV